VLKIQFPTNESHLEAISEGFSEYCHGRMKGCVMAMDGWVCKTKKPPPRIKNPRSYRNRKNCWGMVAFAGCDHECKFIMFSAQNSGSTNDIIAWKMTSVYNYIVKENIVGLPHRFFFACDEAVPADEWVLTPYGGRGLGAWKDSFNYHLSAMRQTIERAFGLLVARWGIFWRPLQCSFNKWTLVMNVCAKLHNVCIESNSKFDKGVFEDYAPGDRPSEVQRSHFKNPDVRSDEDTSPNSHRSSFKREIYTRWLRDNKYKRAYHASKNSKEK
jgi:hypothetical protein